MLPLKPSSFLHCTGTQWRLTDKSKQRWLAYKATLQPRAQISPQASLPSPWSTDRRCAPRCLSHLSSGWTPLLFYYPSGEVIPPPQPALQSPPISTFRKRSPSELQLCARLTRSDPLSKQTQTYSSSIFVDSVHL